MSNRYVLAIDQGTTNSRAIIFNQLGQWISHHDMSLRQTFPHDGWVEQDPEALINHTITCCREALRKSNLTQDAIEAIGITNQRETTIIWDRETGKAIYPAIVWQDRRTASLCKTLADHPISQSLSQKTGLRLDPYFSATKIMWILQHVEGAYQRAHAGDLLFGTVDTFLLWRLTHGKTHATDATNASRTLLFNLHTQSWDETILKAFDIPATMLPTVLDNAAYFGEMHQSILGKSIPITGMAGDQQAATIGQACFHPGMIKATYGTGCFLMLNTGEKAIQSNNQLLTTIAYRLHGRTTYGLEGSIFSAGTIIKWLRDALHLIEAAHETEALAKRVPDASGVYLVPAFTGLGAPYWDPEARGALLGLTYASTREHIARAALESVAYQTRDLLRAMTNDHQAPFATLRVDGGMAANHWLLQFLADILNISVDKPTCIETTALGAAYLAGLQIGIYQSLEEIAELWQVQQQFIPTMSSATRDSLYQGWLRAVRRVMNS